MLVYHSSTGVAKSYEMTLRKKSTVKHFPHEQFYLGQKILSIF